jgi:hypothetical protein
MDPGRRPEQWATGTTSLLSIAPVPNNRGIQTLRGRVGQWLARL